MMKKKINKDDKNMTTNNDDDNDGKGREKMTGEYGLRGCD